MACKAPSSKKKSKKTAGAIVQKQFEQEEVQKAFTELLAFGKQFSPNSEVCERTRYWKDNYVECGHSQIAKAGGSGCKFKPLLSVVLLEGLYNIREEIVECAMHNCPYLVRVSELEEHGTEVCGIHLCCSKCHQVLSGDDKGEDECSYCRDRD